MGKPTILIAGGSDKQSDYNEWIRSFDGKVKCLLLIGQTREKIAECARANGFTDIHLMDNFRECLEFATGLAKFGDAVLLSPACASLDMFPNYEVRGVQFKEYVYSIEE
jgi:UDP-N-acetylmuramoylalanine--D-glutamate ligase